ncbi:hypothetical protein ACOIC7_28575, partial [Klebsiella pneumoniae]|uniref:hypothetical protein n=1 Tax=Klebsiella pneumoniae TaxID=573 RepID=UPI003B5C7F0B
MQKQERGEANVLKSGPKHFRAFICSEVKFISCVSGGFSGGLLPVLPFCRQKRPERCQSQVQMSGVGQSWNVRFVPEADIVGSGVN